MLALLSAPRGRVSAARIAARAREDAQARAQRTVLRMPATGEPAGVTPERQPPASITRDHPER